MALADLNGDSNLDAITANQADSTASVMLGLGDGTFAARTDFVADLGAVWIDTGDLNRDTIPDIVVGNYFASSVSVLLGTGTGSFGSATSFPVPPQSPEGALADFNEDGSLDVAVASRGTNTVAVLLGLGTGALGAATTYPTGPDPHSLEAGDFNNDTHVDLVAGNNLENTVRVFLGRGDGSFAPGVDVVADEGPRSLALGDLNADGDLDLVSANDYVGNISVVLGNGDGTFAASVNYPRSGVYAVALGDFNADGHLDVVTSNAEHNTASIFWGDGTGAIGGETTYVTGLTPWSIAAGRIDADATSDFVVANYFDNNVMAFTETAMTCRSDEHVLGHECFACPFGTTRPAGDDPSGADTECAAVIPCEENEHVLDHTCVLCMAPYTRPPGDLPNGPDTLCDAPSPCEENEHVVDHVCVVCPEGSTRPAGDDPSLADTNCVAPPGCGENEFVFDHRCLPCAAGTENPAGDDPTGDNTSCTAIAFCGDTETFCSDTCVDLNTSVLHCGRCDNACPAIEHGAHGCVDGACEAVSCDAGYELSDGACVEACGTPDMDLCTDDWCNQGRTVHTPRTETDFNDCTLDVCALGVFSHPTKANGTLCDDGNPCTVNSRCFTGICSGGEPADPSDNQMCTTDSCDPFVGFLHERADDSCREVCPETIGDCDSMAECETPLDTVDNCGACGTRCTGIAHATARCIAGSCGFAQCEIGYGSCDGSTSNGCETNLLGDRDNCGSCGTICTTECIEGVCAEEALTCSADTADCDGEAANGCETNLSALDDCGECGNLCTTVAHGAVACVARACVVTCEDGYYLSGGRCRRCDIVDDGDACTRDVCTAGASSHEAVDVDDNNPCTIDVCSPSAGIRHPHQANGTICGTDATCQDGACTYTKALPMEGVPWVLEAGPVVVASLGGTATRLVDGAPTAVTSITVSTSAPGPSELLSSMVLGDGTQLNQTIRLSPSGTVHNPPLQVTVVLPNSTNLQVLLCESSSECTAVPLESSLESSGQVTFGVEHFSFIAFVVDTPEVDESEEPDAGVPVDPDASVADAGTDAGSSAHDSGTTDAGSAVEADDASMSESDAGSGAFDSGSPDVDAASMDAGDPPKKSESSGCRIGATPSEPLANLWILVLCGGLAGRLRRRRTSAPRPVC